MLGTREYTLCSPFRANAHNSSYNSLTEQEILCIIFNLDINIFVTFVVCVQLAPNSDVSTAFWVTLKHDVTRVAMAAHEY